MMPNNLKNIGRMSLNKLLIIACVLISPYSFAQKKKKKTPEVIEYPAMKVIEKDTVIIFTLEQARELSKENEERKKLLSDIKIMSSQMKFKDSVIRMQEKQVLDLKLVKFDYDEIVKQMQRQQQACSDEKAILNDEISKQRRHKNLSIGAGILSFGTLLYFYIHK